MNNASDKTDIPKYSVGQIVKFKAGVFNDKNMLGKVVATRTDKPNTYFIVWFEENEAWKEWDKIIEVCPIETLKEAAKIDPALEKIMNLSYATSMELLE